MNSTEKGNQAEILAANYLMEKGYTLLEKNARFKHAEVDLIMQKANTLLFVEVKYRRNLDYGMPEGFVNKKKKILYRLLADEYIYKHNWNGEYRFDIISIANDGNKLIYEHFEDAFI
jgi:putative endonuclease